MEVGGCVSLAQGSEVWGPRQRNGLHHQPGRLCLSPPHAVGGGGWGGGSRAWGAASPAVGTVGIPPSPLASSSSSCGGMKPSGPGRPGGIPLRPGDGEGGRDGRPTPCSPAASTRWPHWCPNHRKYAQQPQTGGRGGLRIRKRPMIQDPWGEGRGWSRIKIDRGIQKRYCGGMKRNYDGMRCEMACPGFQDKVSLGPRRPSGGARLGLSCRARAALTRRSANCDGRWVGTCCGEDSWWTRFVEGAETGFASLGGMDSDRRNRRW